MVNLTVKVDTIEKAKAFNAAAQHVHTEAELMQGRYVTDAKSIMALFSLDLMKPMELLIYDGQDATGKYKDLFGEFLAEGEGGA